MTNSRTMYAAVLTISSLKANESELSLVLTEWLKGKVLHYPPHPTDMLIEGYLKLGNQAPKPDKRWSKFSYILKQRFAKYDEGIAYVLANQNAFSETEDKSIDNLKRMQLEINNEHKQG